ncbi:error-prone DNA polymerase [Alteromonas sp. a30]|uniref:error-prone DNA polymerase n=1 Tax=Alteromonas sp. a30 TaxID=2730917 RepID=UPI00227F10E1|nr:error-prone DNA polymerase [Alteromonas sp. a30]MCY7295784.1 error-prone DNA polymerase [Alteromonas sp. a30]
MSYAELFCQSNFSFLTGASHPQELIQQAHFLGYEALAITDECSIAGVVKAHTTIKNHNLGIKLIIGSLFRLKPGLELILLCPNHQAYSELCRIITNARRRSPKGEYSLNEWDLKTSKHCLAIWLPNNDRKENLRWAKWLLKYFHNRLWIGYQRHLTCEEASRQKECEYLSQQFNIPITACGGVLMHSPEKLALQHTLSAIKAGKPLAQIGQTLLSNTERSLRSIPKLHSLFPNKWIAESRHIAQKCGFNLDCIRDVYAYPKELVPEGKSPSTYLRELVLKGLKKRFSEKPLNYFYIKRTLIKELRLIKEMQYEYFFLTIFDIIQFAQRARILYQGRGSAANSIVCYCLEITAVDPSQIDVLFERFISKERAEPPDIDVDFEHHRREEVIQYIYAKYGRERTALAATVITYRFKSALREVGKILNINESQLDFFIKNIDRRDREVGWESQIKELGLNNQKGVGKRLVLLVTEIIGHPRHLSQHVGGFVIASEPLYQVVPIENASMTERTVIQWDKDDLESLGLLKVDVLALGMLSAIRRCFNLIEQHYKLSLGIADITRLPPDPKVYNMIQQADTVGVFQIESRAQMSMLPRLKPTCYYDLVIQIAIVRPGPIQGDMVHPFLLRRSGLEKEDYPSDEVKKVLSRTMGVPIFQEQVIKLAMVAAGFTGGEADQLRRAMASWKKNGELLKFRDKLVRGMLERGYKQAFAERIFKQICGFGEYGFPESHSASFAVLAYVSSWLKYYYPAAFYTSLLNSLPMGFYPASQLLQDAKRQNVIVLPICINHSYYEHRLEDSNSTLSIRLGFKLVKGFSEKAALVLLNNRPKSGFTNIHQLTQCGLQTSELEMLASADAMHSIQKSRFATRWSLMNSESTLPLFVNNVEPSDDVIMKAPTDIEDLIEDYASTRVSIRNHPIALLEKAGLTGKFVCAAHLSMVKHKSVVTVVGLVIGRQSPGTASGVTFVTLEDYTGNVNVVVWLATARAQRPAFLKSKIARITGILEKTKEGVTHLIAGRIEDLTEHLESLITSSRDFH